MCASPTGRLEALGLDSSPLPFPLYPLQTKWTLQMVLRHPDPKGHCGGQEAKASRKGSSSNGVSMHTLTSHNSSHPLHFRALLGCVPAFLLISDTFIQGVFRKLDPRVETG